MQDDSRLEEKGLDDVRGKVHVYGGGLEEESKAEGGREREVK